MMAWLLCFSSAAQAADLFCNTVHVDDRLLVNGFGEVDSVKGLIRVAQDPSFPSLIGITEQSLFDFMAPSLLYKMENCSKSVVQASKVVQFDYHCTSHGGIFRQSSHLIIEKTTGPFPEFYHVTYGGIHTGAAGSDSVIYELSDCKKLN